MTKNFPINKNCLMALVVSLWPMLYLADKTKRREKLFGFILDQIN